MDFATWTLINATARGAFMGKTQDEAYEHLEEMTMSNYQLSSERTVLKKPARVYELDFIAVLSIQVASFTK